MIDHHDYNLKHQLKNNISGVYKMYYCRPLASHNIHVWLIQNKILWVEIESNYPI